MPPQPKANTALKLELLVAFFALVAIGFVIFEMSQMTQELATANARIDALQGDVSALQTSSVRTSLSPQGSMPSFSSAGPTMAPGSVPMPMNNPIEPRIKITLPKAGQVLCRDENLAIDWSIPTEIADEIMISISSSKMPGGQIANETTSYNEEGLKGVGHYFWKVGAITFPGGNSQVLPDDDFYQISYMLFKSGNSVYNGKSDSFSINTCKG